MVDEEKEQEPRRKEKKDGAGEDKQPKRKLPLKLIVVGVLALGLLGGGGFFAWRYLGASREKAEASAEPEAIGQTYRPEQFIVNLVDPLGRRYLKVQLELEMDTPPAVEEAKKRDAQIRDSVITLLSAKSYGDIDSPEGKLLLRQEIIARVNQFLRHGKAVNAYFTDFVIQ